MDATACVNPAGGVVAVGETGAGRTTGGGPSTGRDGCGEGVEEQAASRADARTGTMRRNNTFIMPP